MANHFVGYSITEIKRVIARLELESNRDKVEANFKKIIAELEPAMENFANIEHLLDEI